MGKSDCGSEMGGQGFEKGSYFVLICKVYHFGSLWVFVLKLLPVVAFFEIHAVELHQRSI